eukprot:CAMPEP_0117020920 /NCGR_PEP_ID=MMETSP0472-20121206/15844_1 /TAXON_ID=693140 ORGANISM="Tiarina fusus, Strain LIS" /NCGR_SAMPLE_ID=MMETSP0472 /ASSEMBLY_ACC=CAM_ASM_000603 /LENGTH=427 /DNA_ID=CAMNT_0004726259 /DNA_START=35 /DNA_END=1318 /DNA_ORIENTATION=-
MKYSSTCILFLLAGSCDAFAPSKFGSMPRSTVRSMAVDPASLHDSVLSLKDAFSSLSISDAMDAVDSAASAVSSVAVQSTAALDPTPAVEAAAEVAKSENGWFGFLTGPIEGLLQLIHTGLVAVGVDQDAWGVSIIAMTLIIKLATFPLTKSQLESTNKMQALQPKIKEIQAKYQSNPEVMNQKVAEMYQTNNVNPLAGCLPSLVQIPVFIGLYRGVLDLAKENKLDEPFLWLPNLEGPVYGADPTQANNWIFQWVDGSPPLGWDDTLAFLALPLFLVVSQFISMEIMQPKDGPQQGNFVLKLLPLMIGWFSLNVPAALCLYWVTNNIVTTATSVIIRNSMKMEPVTMGGDSAASAAPPAQEIFAPPPMRERPAGFASPASEGGVTPITAIDAEVIEESDPSEEEGFSAPEASKKRGSKKKKKRRKN